MLYTYNAVPGPMLMPPPVLKSNIYSRYVIVSWNPPPDPNGIIENYTVIVVPLTLVNSSFLISKREEPSTDSSVSRCVTSLNQDGRIVVSTDGMTTIANLTGLSEDENTCIIIDCIYCSTICYISIHCASFYCSWY